MWHTSRRFVALGHDFAVRAEDPRLIERIDWAYADLRADGEPAGWYDISGTGGSRYALCWGAETLAAAVTAGKALAWLQWYTNRRAAESVPGPVLHAGAVESPRGAVLVVGRSGAGKSTLVALLLQAGLRYLTDEAVAFDPDGRVRPYPKPLALSKESIELLGVAGYLPGRADDGSAEKHLIPASLLSSTGTGVAVPTAVVVFPTREPGQTPEACQLGRAVGIHALMSQLHSMGNQRELLDSLVRYAGRASFHRIRASDSRSLVEVVSGLVE